MLHFHDISFLWREKKKSEEKSPDKPNQIHQCKSSPRHFISFLHPLTFIHPQFILHNHINAMQIPPSSSTPTSQSMN